MVSTETAMGSRVRAGSTAQETTAARFIAGAPPLITGAPLPAVCCSIRAIDEHRCHGCEGDRPLVTDSRGVQAVDPRGPSGRHALDTGWSIAAIAARAVTW